MLCGGFLLLIVHAYHHDSICLTALLEYCTTGDQCHDDQCGQFWPLGKDGASIASTPGRAEGG